MSDISDIEEDQTAPIAPPGLPGQFDPKRHAREQHNALERRRRDNIKDMYTSLREVVPDTNGERVQASRAVILKRAIETIEKGQSDSAALSIELAAQEAKNQHLKEEGHSSRSENAKRILLILSVCFTF
ncbi:Protein CBR-MXL-1 [Caenorhabditis briggsae]|uniref:Protein CBR-MXL-1 n=1 Tax=Caenorhabditis briggsae TaxID=6238 RepID=A8Y4L3_CAEBR|nr:Protein CBR-MXL-1 [Caenorhabditis briggsae]CAP39833.2 Protein CBR-MXL-1 [Caenorhabditis briggsae]